MPEACVADAGEGASLPRFVFGWRTTRVLAAAAAIMAASASQCARAQDTGATFAPEQIQAGAAIFARNCAPCHGAHMRDPESAFDLRTFPRDAHERFVSSVTNGKNQMPPWGGMLKPEDVEALWAYVLAGER
jgi:mono/diheme cytochrome c family protein